MTSVIAFVVLSSAAAKALANVCKATTWTRSERVTLFLILAFLLARSLRNPLLPGSDIRSAATGEATRTAVIWVISLAGVLLWLGYLALTRRMNPLAQLGSASPLLLLFGGVYLLSAVSSPAIALSFFLLIELIAMVIVFSFAFSRYRSIRPATDLLSAWLFIHLAVVEISSGLGLIPPPSRLPSHGAIAVVAVLVATQRLVRLPSPLSAFMLVASVIALGVVDSLAAYVALGVASTTAALFVLFRSHAIPIWVCVVSLGLIEAVWQPLGIAARASSLAQSLTGRSQTSTETLTGRVPLWELIVERVDPGVAGLGLGFERSAVAGGVFDGLLWAPTNAHNGLLSAWIAGGFMGLLLGLLLIILLFIRAVRAPASELVLTIASATSLVVANISNSLFPASFSPSWLLVLAVLFAGLKGLETNLGAEKIRTSAPQQRVGTMGQSETTIAR